MPKQSHTIYHQPVPLLYRLYPSYYSDIRVPCVCLCIGPDTQVLLPPINTSSPGAFLEHPTGTRASDLILLKAELWWSVALRKGVPALVGVLQGEPQGSGPWALLPEPTYTALMSSCLGLSGARPDEWAQGAPLRTSLALSGGPAHSPSPPRQQAGHLTCQRQRLLS